MNIIKLFKLLLTTKLKPQGKLNQADCIVWCAFGLKPDAPNNVATSKLLIKYAKELNLPVYAQDCLVANIADIDIDYKSYGRPKGLKGWYSTNHLIDQIVEDMKKDGKSRPLLICQAKHTRPLYCLQTNGINQVIVPTDLPNYYPKHQGAWQAVILSTQPSWILMEMIRKIQYLSYGSIKLDKINFQRDG